MQHLYIHTKIHLELKETEHETELNRPEYNRWDIGKFIRQLSITAI